MRLRVERVDVDWDARRFEAVVVVDDRRVELSLKDREYDLRVRREDASTS